MVLFLLEGTAVCGQRIQRAHLHIIHLSFRTRKPPIKLIFSIFLPKQRRITDSSFYFGIIEILLKTISCENKEIWNLGTYPTKKVQSFWIIKKEMFVEGQIFFVYFLSARSRLFKS